MIPLTRGIAILDVLTRLARLEANDAVLLLAALGTAGQYKEKTPLLRRSSLMCFVVNVHVVVTGGLPTSIVLIHIISTQLLRGGSMSVTVHTLIDEFDSSRTLARPSIIPDIVIAIHSLWSIVKLLLEVSRFKLSSLPPPCAKNNAPR